MGALEEILKVRIEGHELILAGWSDKTLKTIRQSCEEVKTMGDRLRIRVSNPEQMEAVLKSVFEQKMELISMNPIRPSLEEYFFQEIKSGPQ